LKTRRKQHFQLEKNCGNLLFELCNAPAIFERLKSVIAVIT